jgi:rhamnosyltransferase
VGPRLIDAETGLEHGFHQIRGIRWTRCYPAPNEAVVDCQNLNCSGTLMSRDVWARLGGLEESLFLDHLDTEWSFRVRAAGYGLFGIPAIAFVHRMGQTSWRVWLWGWKIWPYRSPIRHFFLFRNAILLMRRDYVPRVWKFWAALKLLITALIHLIWDTQRRAQLCNMFRGVCAGFQGNVDNSSSRFL